MNQENQLRLLHGPAGPLHAQALHLVLRLPEARRVDEPQQHPATEDRFLHRVPGGPWHVGDNGPLIARQGV